MYITTCLWYLKYLRDNVSRVKHIIWHTLLHVCGNLNETMCLKSIRMCIYDVFLVIRIPVRRCVSELLNMGVNRDKACVWLLSSSKASWKRWLLKQRLRRWEITHNIEMWKFRPTTNRRCKIEFHCADSLWFILVIVLCIWKLVPLGAKRGLFQSIHSKEEYEVIINC